MIIKKNVFIKNYYGLISGLLVFFAFLFFIPDSSMPEPVKKMAGSALLMAIWWITEAIPIPVTAILPIVLFPLLKIMPTGQVTVNYGHHLIFLFLGGFIIALTIERWNLHKRIALKIIHFVGTNQRLIILGFMIATAFLSMWISNTATTMMMIPIGMAIITQMSSSKSDSPFIRGKNNFALASGFQESGLTHWLGEQLKTLHFLPLGVIILIVCAMATFTTEFASNTAMASTLLPILASLSVALGINPIILMVPATISCSTAFMLPIATPPNAIVFGSGYLQIRDMVKVGLIMNILGLILIFIVVHLLAELVFNIDWNQMPVWAK